MSILEGPGILTGLGVMFAFLVVGIAIGAGLKQTKTIKTIKINKTFNNNEELIKNMKEHGLSDEMIRNMTNNGLTTNITTQQTIREVQYINGELVSDKTHTTNNEITPITNCPNCGANVEHDTSGKCHYCNTTFNTYQINNK